jgi:DNA (cytosine-5)-methyltransferase 1
MMETTYLTAIDLFSGCGGLTEGLKQAGFRVIAGVEADKNAAKAFRLNHSETTLFEDDIRKLDTDKVIKLLKGMPLHVVRHVKVFQV